MESFEVVSSMICGVLEGEVTVISPMFSQTLLALRVELRSREVSRMEWWVLRIESPVYFRFLLLG